MLPTIEVAGQPPRGHGFHHELYGDDRCAIALGVGSQTGFDIDYELADEVLPSLAAAALAGDVERGYREAAAPLQALIAAHGPHDDGLPMLTAITALCTASSVELSWVGDDKAYLIRGRTIVAETREHTHWRDIGEGKVRSDWAPLLAKIDPNEPWAADTLSPFGRRFRLMLGYATRTITADGCTPERGQFDVQPGDALLLVSNYLHGLIGWRAGIERVLARAAAVDAEVILAEAHAHLRSINPGRDPEWSGPVVLARW